MVSYGCEIWLPSNKLKAISILGKCLTNSRGYFQSRKAMHKKSSCDPAEVKIFITWCPVLARGTCPEAWIPFTSTTSMELKKLLYQNLVSMGATSMHSYILDISFLFFVVAVSQSGAKKFQSHFETNGHWPSLLKQFSQLSMAKFDLNLATHATRNLILVPKRSFNCLQNQLKAK